MDSFGENIKKLLLAGVGAVAVTAEKSKELLDEMVEKGVDGIVICGFNTDRRAGQGAQ